MGSGHSGDKGGSSARRASSSSGGMEGPGTLVESAGGDSVQATTSTSAPVSSGRPPSTQRLRSGSSVAKPGLNAETDKAAAVDKAAESQNAEEAATFRERLVVARRPDRRFLTNSIRAGQHHPRSTREHSISIYSVVPDEEARRS